MTRFLMFALGVVLALTLACGDDDTAENAGGGQNPDGPAEDVAGPWQGTYSSDSGVRSGALCLTIEQDNREITGAILFQDEPLLRVGGTIANDTMAIVWSPQTGGAGSATPEQSASVGFITGGTLTGVVEGDSFEGAWTSLDSDRGTWTAARTDTCS